MESVEHMNSITEPRSYWRNILSRFLRQPRGIIALSLLILLILSAVFADFVAPYDPIAINFSNRYLPPAWVDGGSPDYLLGTDSNGRDMLSRIIYGGRISLVVGFVSSTVASILGISLGIVAGYAGGLVDRVIMRLVDMWIALPFLVIAIAVIAILGSDVPTLVALLSVAGLVYPARITRTQTLQLHAMDYVIVAVALGAKPLHIIIKHILPNVLTANIVIWTFSVGTLIIVESALSFLGLGVKPPTPSWGNILSDGRSFITTGEWWLSVLPGFAIVLTVLCVNTLGDSLQEVFDTRIQQQ